MITQKYINIWIWALLCIPCLLASCDHDVHEDENKGGLSVSLVWQDDADRGTDVKDVRLWFFNAEDGSLVEEKHYATAEELASQRFAPDKGNYHILAAVNLTEPFTIGETASGLSDWNNIMIGLTDLRDVKRNAYFGVTDVRIDNKEGYYAVQIPIRSVLAELSVIIEDVPNGTEMSGKALDCANCLFPTLKNADDNYGLSGIEPVEVKLPAIMASENTLQSGVIRLMPTIQNSPASHIYLHLSLPNGTLQEYDITAPAMKAGGKYELRFEYDKMQPKMNLDATINNWKDLTNEVEIK